MTSGAAARAHLARIAGQLTGDLRAICRPVDGDELRERLATGADLDQASAPRASGAAGGSHEVPR